jgi:hypothetical protein
VVTRAAQDYYEALGVSKDADKKAIKSAYRQKVSDLEFEPCSRHSQHVLLTPCARMMRDQHCCVRAVVMHVCRLASFTQM